MWTKQTRAFRPQERKWTHVCAPEDAVCTQELLEAPRDHKQEYRKDDRANRELAPEQWAVHLLKVFFYCGMQWETKREQRQQGKSSKAQQLPDQSNPKMQKNPLKSVKC